MSARSRPNRRVRVSARAGPQKAPACANGGGVHRRRREASDQSTRLSLQCAGGKPMRWQPQTRSRRTALPRDLRVRTHARALPGLQGTHGRKASHGGDRVPAARVAPAQASGEADTRCKGKTKVEAPAETKSKSAAQCRAENDSRQEISAARSPASVVFRMFRTTRRSRARQASCLCCGRMPKPVRSAARSARAPRHPCALLAGAARRSRTVQSPARLPPPSARLSR